MANATLLELKDLVKAKRPETMDNPSFLGGFIDELINQAQRFVQLNLAHLGIKEWETTDVLSLSSGTLAEKNVKTAPLSTDCPNRLFDDERAIKYLDCKGATNGNFEGFAFYVDDEVFLRRLRNSFQVPTLLEPIFTRHNQLILIAPSTVISAIAHYYKQVADMTTDAANTQIPEMYEEHIVKRVLVDIDDILGKLQNKQMDLQQLTTDLQQSFQSQEIAVQSDKQPKGELV